MKNLYDVDLMVKARINASITQLKENLKLYDTLSFNDSKQSDETVKAFNDAISSLEESKKVYQSYRDSYFKDYSEIEKKLKEVIEKVAHLKECVDYSQGESSFDVSLNEQILKEVDYVIGKLNTAIDEVEELPALSQRINRDDYVKTMEQFEKDELTHDDNDLGI